ncbi:trichohyalin-like isoform X2 [Mya arenaria]|uniref:trichohyalin-like isoform X2 n=1 Tax=Mya arenaria TaxID=6604 RepID=UPI0022E0BFC0|nr:trichohyalin-like isoform X2 [Mya arenaria]
MSSKSTKGSAKPAGKGKESKVIKKSSGPSLDKLQKENEDLRKQLRVASGQLAYLRENLDPSAFRKAAGITSMDGNHIYDDALKSAEEMINKQKCELEELQRNKQSQVKEMDGKTRNEKDVSKDGGNATLKAEIEKLKEQIKELTTQLSEAERNNRPVKGTAPAVPVSSTQKRKDVDVQKEKSTLSDEIKRLKDENEKITKDAKLDLEQTKQKLSISLDEEKRLNDEIKRLKDENEKITKDAKLDLEQTKQKLSISLEEEKRLKKRVDENHAKADRNNTNASQSSSSESEKNNVAQAKSTWERKYDETLKKHQAEMDKLQKENDATLDKKDKKYDETLKKHHEEMEKLRKENDATLDKRDKKYDETLKKHHEEMEKLRNENDATLNKRDKEKETLTKQLAKVQGENKDILRKKEGEISKLQDEKKDLEKEISQMKKDLEKKKASPARRDQTHDEGNEEFRKKLKDAQEEITELRNRLSKVVGAKLSDDNPNITDLSDENRPTKLAEKYSELYDNEWTDAYEDAEVEGLDEGKAIAKLLGILMDVDCYCRLMANDFKNNIKRAALSLIENGSNVKETKVDVTRNKLLKEMQKSFAPLLVEDVYKNLVQKNKLKLPKNTERFYRSCVELCWLMSVQDPPVVFDTPKTGGKFDSDRYRTYTKTGNQLDYVVWPPMLLHAGGPLLAKGVAQGK